jgi:non-ribosomal peptide synthetase-like protein
MSSPLQRRIDFVLKPRTDGLSAIETAEIEAATFRNGTVGDRQESLIARLYPAGSLFDRPGALVPMQRSAARGCLHGLFEEQADQDPAAPALECAGRIWSYGEVDAEANRLARHLRSLGVERGRFVGITLDRSEWPVIAILAILKTGAAYVPIEPALPNDRLRYIAEAAGLAVVVTEEHHAARVREICDAGIVTIESYRASARSYPATRLSLEEASVAPDDVCYVLFTSGTTGRPKGVVAEHRNVVHFAGAFNAACDTTSDDRIFQGFTLGFDGSVEEMWMAFSNGATLVCGDATTPRFGADLAAYLQNKNITFLSTVPTLLSTLPHDVPSLRQLVVSGEACHIDLVNRWVRPGLTMRNVYGPTEATVNTTASVLEKGMPVTIGRPLGGYGIYILDAELRPVPHGEKGELYIGGPGLSRGYLNQPELTERAFIEWTPPGDTEAPDAPQKLRLYKAGDLVRWNEEGNLEFFGRIDSQVKVRGYRIELSEIEAVLVEHQNITAAAVKVHDQDGMQSLAAYVLLRDGAPTLDRSRVLATLRDRLPTYMVPSYLDVLPEFPMLASGKVNRGQLPAPEAPLVAEDSSGAVMSPLEASIAAVWATQLRVPKVGPEQNFFTDLGGHSLLAAQLANALRSELNHAVQVRDVYAHPTVRALAARIEATAEGAAQASATTVEAVTPTRPWTTNLFQAFYLLGIVPLLALPVVYILPLGIDAAQGRGSVVHFALTTLGVGLGTWVALILLAVVAKWTLIGRYKPGRYPMWGSLYIRWWIASRLQHLSAIATFNGTPLAPLVWRIMGAKVGRNVMIRAGLVYAWDCVRLGDDVSIGEDTHIAALRVEGGHLVIGTVEIGDRCFVGSHAALGLNVVMEADAKLDDQSYLPDGWTASAGAAYRGSPAQAAEIVVPQGAPLRAGRFRMTLFALVQVIGVVAITLLTLAPVASAAALMAYVAINYPTAISVPAFLVSVPATMFAFAFWSALCKEIVHPNPHAGVHRIYSFKYLQHWLADVVMRIIKVFGRPIFTTVYLPSWMRLLGAKLGRHTEMSTVWKVHPEMLTAGDGVFFADGCMIGGSKTHLGRVEVARNTIGDRSFVGNSAILPAGVDLGSDSLLGVLSAPPQASGVMPDKTDWLGSPAFQLPNRQKVSCFDAKVTYRPSAWLYAQRAVIDGLRVLLPGYVLGGIGLVSLLVVVAVYENYGLWGAYTAIPLLSWATITLCLSFVVGLKWLIMGRFRPVVVPLWSRYVWWNELINGLYECLMAPLMTNFFGTPVVGVMLRMLGCKVGKYCFIETTLFSEFDLVEIGDHVALNAGTIMQNHLFEDRVMKSSKLKIDDGCSIGNMSVVLYDTHIGSGATLRPLSLLMKGETMPAGSCWHGVPTVRA